MTPASTSAVAVTDPCVGWQNRTEDVMSDPYWRGRYAALKGAQSSKPTLLVSILEGMIATFKASVVRCNCRDAEHKAWAEKEAKVIDGPLLKNRNATWRAAAKEKLKKAREEDHDIYLSHLKMDHAGMSRLNDALVLARKAVSETGSAAAKTFESSRQQALFLCTEALEASSDHAKAPPAVLKLQKLAKALSGVAAAPHAPPGSQKVADDVARVLKEVRGETDAAKVDAKVRPLMQEVHDYKISLDKRMTKLTTEQRTDREESVQMNANDKFLSEQLFKRLLDIQDYPMEKQLAVMAEPTFQKLPVAAVLRRSHSDAEPLAMQVGEWLDVQKRAAKEKARRAREARLAKLNSKLDGKKSSALAGIMDKLQGRVADLASHEKDLEKLDRMNQEAAMTKHRLILKAKARDDAEAVALKRAIAGIEAGKVEGLQAAMEAIKKMA